MKNFSDAARPVCEAFCREISRGATAEYLVILMIRQISKGQIQLVYTATPSIEKFVEAIDIWSASGVNLPAKLRVPLPSKKNPSSFRFYKPALLFPEDINRLLSHQWIRSGKESSRVNAPPVGMVLDLFLQKQGVWQGIACELLELTLAGANILLKSVGHILRRDNLDWNSEEYLKGWSEFVNSAKSAKDKRYPDYAFAQTISLIGSLLYAMNSKVENYVHESAFLVGKLLAMMDELHKCYCIVAREGDLPPTLIGNGLLGRAADSPARAIEELCDRGRIYLGWAKTAAAGEKASEKVKIAVNSARKLLRIAAPLCEQLHDDSDLDKTLEPVEKAHLFLGYLSPVLGGDEGKSDEPTDADQDASQANI
jgi:hypothetical protein